VSLLLTAEVSGAGHEGKGRGTERFPTVQQCPRGGWCAARRAIHRDGLPARGPSTETRREGGAGG